MKLSIIIVNYNTYKLTKQTIESIDNSGLETPYEIILVDNASSDNSIDKIEQDFKQYIDQKTLIIIKNNVNLGFSKANNLGIKVSTGTYILLLNSDTYIAKGCLEKSLKYIESHLDIGALGCKVVLPDGTLDHACKRGFPTPRASLYYFLKLHKKDPIKYGLYDALYLDEDSVGEVDSLMGAFMLMPREVLNKVGLLDEDFFMYGEDIDLCYRIKQAGLKVVYYPEAKIIHYKGGSSTKKKSKIIYDFHHAMWIFYKKHYYNKYALWISVAVYIGIGLKYCIALIRNALKH